MLFRRDLGRSGSALACNILADARRGRIWPSSRDAPMPGSRRHRTPPKACGPGFLGQGVGEGCTGLRPHASAPPPRAATCPHSTPAPHPAQPCRRHARHGTGRPALRTHAFAPPKHAPKARRLAPCARLTSARPLCRSDLTVLEEGGHRTSTARSSRRSWRAASGGSQGPAAKPRPAPAAPLPASQPRRARSWVG